jgi:hypothetical protein
MSYSNQITSTGNYTGQPVNATHLVTALCQANDSGPSDSRINDPLELIIATELQDRYCQKSMTLSATLERRAEAWCLTIPLTRCAADVRSSHGVGA